MHGTAKMPGICARSLSRRSSRAGFSFGRTFPFGQRDPVGGNDGFSLAGRVRPLEMLVRMLLLASSLVAILVTIGIVLSMAGEAVAFFSLVPFSDFLFGLDWSPQTAIRSDQVGATGSFGVVPLLAGTLLVSTIAMLVAVPLGVLSAICLAEYAAPRARSLIKPVLEILAGIPSVVYGFFAVLVLSPLIRALGEELGVRVASESALAAGLVMGVMLMPLVLSLSEDAISAVPANLREASLALGATRGETMARVIVPAAMPGIAGGVLLAASAAIGETMIVVMAAGMGARLTANPLEAVTTVTVQIVALLTGDQAFDSAKTLSAFALGLLLFLLTLLLNVAAFRIARQGEKQFV